MKQQTENRPLLTDTLPAFASDLRQFLEEQSESELAAQVPGLIVHRHQSSAIRAKPPG
jgi:hypothetical protein